MSCYLFVNMWTVINICTQVHCTNLRVYLLTSSGRILLSPPPFTKQSRPVIWSILWKILMLISIALSKYISQCTDIYIRNFSSVFGALLQEISYLVLFTQRALQTDTICAEIISLLDCASKAGNCTVGSMYILAPSYPIIKFIIAGNTLFRLSCWGDHILVS